MSNARFHWHPMSRAFAGSEEVTPQDGPPRRHIPGEPLTDAFEGLHRAFFSNTPFCLAAAAPANLSLLRGSTFATLTGGTSGPPKIIRRSQASWIHSFQANASYFAYKPSDSVAVLGALSHSLALYGVLEGLHLGMNVHALSPLAPRAQIAQMIEHECRILYATPTQLGFLPADTCLPALRLILCGGGTLSAPMRRHIAALAPNAALHIFYGAAETSFITLGDAQTPDGSVGTAYPEVEIEIRNPDSAGSGLIWVRSPYLSDGYLDGDSPHTQRHGDWLTVGEVGTLDESGYLYLRGRAGRMVNIADTAIFPEEVEAVLGAVPSMPACVILARLDALRGHHLVAVLAGPDLPGIRDTLLDACKANGLIRPREIVFLDPFPLLASGKPDLSRIAALTGCTL